MDERSLHVEVHFGEGMFWAQVGEWGGCLPQGDSLDELVEALCEAIGLYVTSDDEEPGPIWLRVDGDRASR
jgi:predicted RNase H-like HicB family nuclease